MAKAGGKNSTGLESVTDNQVVLHEWLNAIDDFSQWKQQLDVVMETYEAIATGGQSAKSPLVTAALCKLHSEIAAVMETLVSEADWMEEQNESFLQQLAVHTNTLRRWSRKIRHVLSVHASATA